VWGVQSQGCDGNYNFLAGRLPDGTIVTAVDPNTGELFSIPLNVPPGGITADFGFGALHAVPPDVLCLLRHGPLPVRD
jgi:hypothetical protein